MSDEEQGREGGSWLGDLPTLVVAVGVALLIRTFLFQSFYVPSESMLPTMLVGDHVFVNKIVYGLKIPFADRRVLRFRPPRRGEVVVFQLGRGPAGAIQPADLRTDWPRDAFVKRLVGLPGDRIEVRGGRVIVNGEVLPLEPTGESFQGNGGAAYDVWIETLGECRHRVLDDPARAGIDMPEITIRPGRYLFLGDNRDNSKDGRVFGTVRLEEMEGPAGLMYWSWAWNGSWLSLLNPLTWWENLTRHTRWSRLGGFHACLPDADG